MIINPVAALALLTLAQPASEPQETPWLALTARAELGFLAPLAHRVQFDRGGTVFDYVDQGGQDVLFPFARLSAEAAFNERHKVTFLYQPLDLRTRVLLDEDVIVDEQTFPSGTPLDLRYGFSFWRASYAYDFAESRDTEVALGVGLQIRNATILFQSANGELRRVNRDLGPVPLLGGRFRMPLGNTYWFGAEAEGIWAPVSYINGGDSDVEGAILDASARVGARLRPNIDGFINIRYLGGGAQGTSDDDEGPGDGYTSNWLHFLTVSLGVSLDFLPMPQN